MPKPLQATCLMSNYPLIAIDKHICQTECIFQPGLLRAWRITSGKRTANVQKSNFLLRRWAVNTSDVCSLITFLALRAVGNSARAELCAVRVAGSH